MDVDTAFLELKGLSKTIRIFHGMSVDDQNSRTPQHTSSALDLWIKFFHLHVLVASQKMKRDPQFRPWVLYLDEVLCTLGLQVCVSPLEYSNLSLFQDVLRRSKQVITDVAVYYKQLIENQLSLLNTHSISISREYLEEATDYYSFWHCKFDKTMCKADHNDIDVILLADSIQLFKQNHEELQNSIVQWSLPSECHYPKLDHALEIFLSSLHPLPTPKYNSSDQLRNLPASRIIVQEEYTTAMEYLSTYAKQLDVRCKSVFPIPDLDRRFKRYREELEKAVFLALVPLRSACETFAKAREAPEVTLTILLVNDAINSVNSCGKILVIVKRRVRQAVSKFLIRYYRDVLKNLERSKKAISRLRKADDLSFQLQVHNRERAYDVWKEALKTATSSVKGGKLVVVSNVFEAQSYFVNFLNENASNSTST